MRRKIAIYNDAGVGPFGLACLKNAFADDDVRLCKAEDVIDGTALNNRDIFIMPGGEDLPYCRKLDGAGNNVLRAFVENGGTYLGLCAGAYFACRFIDWNDRPALRDLALVDAVAVGPLLDIAGPYTEDDIDACAVALLEMADGRTGHAFYHGGCRFDLSADFKGRVIARYKNVPEKPPAIVESRHGKGRVILSGVHPEMDAQSLKHFPLLNGCGFEKLLSLTDLIASSPLGAGNLIEDMLA